MNTNTALKTALIRREKFYVNPELISGNRDIKLHKYAMGFIEYDPNRHWIVYNFKSGEIFKKNMDKLNLMFSFQNNNYRDLYGNDCSFDMKEYLENYKDSLMLECNLSNGKAILALFDETRYTTKDFDVLYYNLYHTFTTNKFFNIIPSEIELIENKLVKKLHWVWFRKPGAYITERIIKRAYTWITNNPELEFYLWTNLENKEELLDFFKDISNPIRDIFLNKVQIKYKDDTYSVIKEYLINNTENAENAENNWEQYREILENKEDPSAIIFKTDITRLIILYSLGGWYSDFNDTYSFIPLKYLINPEIHSDVDDNPILGCDYMDNCNNYLLYCNKDNKKWSETINIIFKNTINIYKVLNKKDNTVYNSILYIFKEFINVLIHNPLNEKTFFDIIKPYIDNWVTIYNKSINSFIKKENVDIPIQLQLNDNFLLLYLKYIILSIFPNSEIVNRFDYEIKLITTIPNSVKKTTSWKQRPTSDFIMSEEEKQFWRNIQEPNKLDVFNILIRTNIQNIIHMTNIGPYYSNIIEKTIIPFCHIPNEFTFLTSIGHLGDGSSCGYLSRITSDNMI